jgi:hypothetical protein
MAMGTRCWTMYMLLTPIQATGVAMVPYGMGRRIDALSQGWRRWDGRVRQIPACAVITGHPNQTIIGKGLWATLLTIGNLFAVSTAARATSLMLNCWGECQIALFKSVHSSPTLVVDPPTNLRDQLTNLTSDLYSNQPTYQSLNQSSI